MNLTNNASDTPIDLSTPLSRVLFDIQEIDTHIHNLTTKSALPLLIHTKSQTEASQRIVQGVEAQVAALTEGYRRLEEEVIQRYEAAEEVRVTVERLWQTVKIGRAVGRCLLLGRQLDAQMTDIRSVPTGRKEDHRAMTRASNTLVALRQLFAASGPDGESEHLPRIQVVTTLQIELVNPSEQALQTKAQQIIREFSLSPLAPSSTSQPSTTASSTYAQTEETKARTTSACLTLYLLSPLASTTRATEQPYGLLLATLQNYLQTSLTSSLASTARALGTLPTLTRTLLEVSARCQNIVALEALLESIHPPPHPLRGQSTPTDLLEPLLSALDTSSLPSFFWRSLASGLSNRVQEIMNRGGVSARTLKSQRERVKEGIRECVIRGVQGAKGVAGGWEREVGVMVGSVLGALGR